MYSVLRAGEQERSAGGTLSFEGEAHGAGVSFFLVDNEPGAGPSLHRHPYSETWIVRSGTARITADGTEMMAEAGDIVVVGPGTRHKFVNAGTERLDIICIHDSPVFVTDWVEDAT